MDFMDRLGPEVSGRMVARSDEGANALMQRFARGECSKEERTEACKLMQARPHLVRMVASELKQPRDTENARTSKDR